MTKENRVIFLNKNLEGFRSIEQQLKVSDLFGPLSADSPDTEQIKNSLLHVLEEAPDSATESQAG